MGIRLQTHGELKASSHCELILWVHCELIECPQMSPPWDNSGELPVSMVLAHIFTVETFLCGNFKTVGSMLEMIIKPKYHRSAKYLVVLEFLLIISCLKFASKRVSNFHLLIITNLLKNVRILFVLSLLYFHEFHLLLFWQ